MFVKKEKKSTKQKTLN